MFIYNKKHIVVRFLRISLLPDFEINLHNHLCIMRYLSRIPIEFIRKMGALEGKSPQGFLRAQNP